MARRRTPSRAAIAATLPPMADPGAGRELRREAVAAGRGGARQDRRGADRQPGRERRHRPRVRGAREGRAGPGGRDGRPQPALGRRHRAGHPPAALAVAAAGGHRGLDRPARGAPRAPPAQGADRPSAWRSGSTRSPATSPRCASRSRRREPGAARPGAADRHRVARAPRSRPRPGAARAARAAPVRPAAAVRRRHVGHAPARTPPSLRARAATCEDRRGLHLHHRGAALDPRAGLAVARVVEEVAC